MIARIIVAILFLMPAVTLAMDDPAKAYFADIKSSLLLHHGEAALDALESIRRGAADESQSAEQRISQSSIRFADLVEHWKALEAIYIAGVIDEEMLDHPRFIDHYHQGNESLTELMTRILNGETPLASAMFKTSTRGINALEYLLFAEQPATGRRLDAIQRSVAHIESWLEEIVDFYREDDFIVQGGNDSLQMLINALIDSSYRLVNWRVGEPAGLIPKYRDNPDPARLEYRLSGLSIEAIVAILQTHQRVFDLGRQHGYFESRPDRQGLEEIAFANEQLVAALEAARAISGPALTDVESGAFLELHGRLERLHKAYYFLLADALGLETRIVDADGD